jgi:osmotically-inducible protein OsmY
MLTVGCSNTADGVRQDAEDAQREAAQASDNVRDRTADTTADIGDRTDAAVQTMDVKAALVADDRIDASDINVDTDAATKTVILKGFVPNATQKSVAEQIAQTKAEGYSVRNDLSVRGN